ncbi:MAG: glycoside hydrolase family 13 protein [Oscillospiraceae bacterium]
MSKIFDSRDTEYKSPFGAAVCGATVRFAVRPGDENVTGVTLLLRREFAGTEQEVALSPGDDGRWQGVYTAPEEPELVWYAFRFSYPEGQRLYGLHGFDDQARWQLTVYDDSRPTPAWFGRGITYQIFPDRFCRTRVPDPAGMVGDRVVHQDWDDTPVWRPDAQGIIRNNDFFGGSLAGITSRLDYLQSMGVGTLYLCPIFESDSNHRYDTADYRRIDPMLGTEEDFRTLCREAGCRGIRVMLDGVFNHTGSNSRYFNAQGFYPELGAAQSRESQYYNWYSFHPWPEDYDAWWGIKTLPAVQESADSYRRFIIRDGDSVVRHWLRQGASGWRLDVADELPDDFIAEIRSAMDQEKPDSFLLGEVWEDGSNKIAYSQRRRYLLGSETHGLMNYPFRTAALDWLRGGDAAVFRDTMEVIREHYPRPAFYSALNILGTHDTPRILTLLGAEDVPDTKDGRAAYRLSPAQRQKGQARLRVGEMLLYCFPGSPTVYYGDEAGMEGFEDPLNRGTYPWGRRTGSCWPSSAAGAAAPGAPVHAGGGPDLSPCPGRRSGAAAAAGRRDHRGGPERRRGRRRGSHPLAPGAGPGGPDLPAVLCPRREAAAAAAAGFGDDPDMTHGVDVSRETSTLFACWFRRFT